MERRFHHWQKWECFPAGFYDTAPPAGMSHDQARAAYAEFLGDIPRFRAAMRRVVAEWPVSCEQFLTNPDINRVAWLGQSSMCIETGVPSIFRGGFFLLSEEAQRAANAAAQQQLTEWLGGHENEDRAVHKNVGEKGIREWHPRPSAGRIDAATTSPVVQGDLFRHFEK